MSEFDIREASNSDGQPIRLYEFRRGIQYWRYNSSDRDIIRNGRLYQAVAVSDEGVRLSGDSNQDDFVVTMPSSLALPELYRVRAPSSTVWLKVMETHEGLEDTYIAWVGVVTDVSRPEIGTAKVTCQNTVVSFDRVGLRLTWNRNCPYDLYNPRTCRVDKAKHRVELSVTAVDGAGLTLSGLDGIPDGSFTGGFIEWVVYADPEGAEDVKEMRGVDQHIGNRFTIFGGTLGISVGQVFSAYPGCARSIRYCEDVFGNHLNYGGVPALAGKSPFDGDPVF